MLETDFARIWGINVEKRAMSWVNPRLAAHAAGF